MWRARTGSSVLVAILLMLLPTMSSAQTGPDFRKAASKDWPVVGGDWSDTRYSTLDQINTSNVSSLKGAWLARLGSGIGSKYSQQATPVVRNGVMYVTTGEQDVFALNARTGETIWQYKSDADPKSAGIWGNRGVDLGEGLVFAGQVDGSFVALDEKTGKQVWRTELGTDVGRLTEKYITNAPLYYQGLLYTGLSGSDRGVRGRFYALDPKTGAVVWQWYTVPAPGEFGSETWEGDSWKSGGGAIWMKPTMDPDLGMIYFGTGNAFPDYDGAVRGGDNLFTASIVALDLKTGQYKWHFQTVHHEIWDYDAQNTPILFDTSVDGQPRKGLAQTGKTGWVYLLDRTNGTPLLGITEQPVEQDPRQKTAATQPIPVGDSFVPTCAPKMAGFLNGCIFDAFWDIPKVIAPGAIGGNDWAVTSYSPQTNYFYISATVTPMSFSVRHEKIDPVSGLRINLGGGGVSTPIGTKNSGTFTAIDASTNKIAWQKAMTYAIGMGSGSLATAGGLVFHGEPDGHFVAFDARTGDEVWRFQTGFGADAPPMSFEIDGTQYVAIATGGQRGSTGNGDGLWAFSLKGKLGPLYAPPTPKTVVEFSSVPFATDAVAIGRLWDTPAKALGAKSEFTYAPERVRVAVGTTVTFTNEGDVPHTATAQDTSWDTGDIPSGGSAKITFSTAGSFAYSCIPHPWMVGQVIVE